MSNNDMPMM